jgi:hypothetical protein
MSRVEKRKMERFALKLPTTLTVINDDKNQENSVKLSSNDICASGVFVETDKPLKVGSSLEIDIILPLDELKKLEGKRAHISVSGAVLRIEKNGLAIKFNDDYTISPATDEKT